MASAPPRSGRRRLGVLIGVAAAVELAAQTLATILLSDGDRLWPLLLSGWLVIGATSGVLWLILDAVWGRAAATLAAEVQFAAEAAADSEIASARFPWLAPLPVAINALIAKLLAARRETDKAVSTATRRSQEQKSWIEAILRDLGEGVMVCSLDHRILLYNQEALSLLHVGGELGLGRSLLNLVAQAPIDHAIERLLHRPADADPVVSVVCATSDSRALLRGRMSLVLDRDGRPTGYVLTLADVTREVAELGRRDALLREVAEGLRAPLANLRAAAETLAAHPNIDVLRRHAFDQVILRESDVLTNRIETLDREYRQLAAVDWPLDDIHSVDLFNLVIRRLGDGDGPAATMVGLPLWLRGDSLSLVLALERLARRAAEATGARAFDMEALLGDRRVYVEISWTGAPIPAATLDEWLAEPLPGAVGATNLREVLTRHGSEIWSRPATRPERALLRLPLPAPHRVPFKPPAAPLPARPEFYDFELLREGFARGVTQSRPLRAVSYVVFDTETTGLRPSEGDEIIAIGAVRIVNGRILTGETFVRLVNPRRPIPRESIRFHNITDAMVADAPPIQVVLPQFRGFVADSVLVAHNAAFDLKFLRMKESECGVRFANPTLDTMLISAFLYEGIADHSLDAIVQRLGLEVAGRHSALGDAQATAAVFLRLLDLLEARGITTLDALLETSKMMLEIKARQAHF